MSFLGEDKRCLYLIHLYIPTPSLCWPILDSEILGAAGELEAGVGGHTEVSPEGILQVHFLSHPLLSPGDILALVFGILFAVTSIACLVQMRRQRRYVLY